MTARRTGGPILPGRRYPTFQPYQPPPPPSGSYDPALDASRGAASRGLVDTRQDIALGGTRAAEDYGLGVEDFRRSYDRGSSDLNLGLSRGEEDYSRQVEALQRSYSQLGRREAEGARAHGVLSGGLALKAAQVRATNQGIDRQPLDTNIGRLRQDTATGLGRLGEDRDLGIGRLGLEYGRGVTDRSTVGTRATREDTQFGLDTEAQKAFQASQAGWSPPGRGEPGGMPKNEFVRPDGTHVRIVIKDGMRLEVGPGGQILSRRRR